MIVVIHYPNRDPDIYFGINEKTEHRILNDLKKTNVVERSTNWYGQDNPEYTVHHWEAKKK